MLQINNFNLKENSPFKLNDILNNVYIIENITDYLNYIKNSNSDFKVLWELTNTIINPNIEENIDLLFFKDNINLDSINFLEDWIVSVLWNVKLKILSSELLKNNYDCSYLIWIPGTVAAAVVNNSWSWKLWESILDNVIMIEYYIRDKKYIKVINDILFSYRNTEFKFTKNLFISKIYFKFKKIEKEKLTQKMEKRYLDRSNLKEIYIKPSLWTFYIRNNYLKYWDIISKKIHLQNNKILNIWHNLTYKDYINFKRKLNIFYEIEIEEVSKPYKNDYIWLLIIDKNNNILLQKRDNNWFLNKEKIWLFWGGVEENEWLKEALIREIKEELSIDISHIDYNWLFIKDYTNAIQRCFIFKKYVENLNDFIKNIKCKEWNILIDNLSNIDNIINDENYTFILKKVLIYNLK